MDAGTRHGEALDRQFVDADPIEHDAHRAVTCSTWLPLPVRAVAAWTLMGRRLPHVSRKRDSPTMGDRACLATSLAFPAAYAARHDHWLPLCQEGHHVDSNHLSRGVARWRRFR